MARWQWIKPVGIWLWPVLLLSLVIWGLLAYMAWSMVADARPVL